MRIALGSDHAGFRLKQHLVATLPTWGHEVVDLGTDSPDSVDYPPFCAAVGRRVVAGDVDRIVSLFAAELWTDVTVERWRYAHEPLPRYPTPAADVGYVHGTIKSYDLGKIAELQTSGSVWLLTVTALKRRANT